MELKEATRLALEGRIVTRDRKLITVPQYVLHWRRLRDAVHRAFYPSVYKRMEMLERALSVAIEAPDRPYVDYTGSVCGCGMHHFPEAASKENDRWRETLSTRECISRPASEESETWRALRDARAILEADKEAVVYKAEDATN